MARPKKASASYETVAADSGYLSDLMETAREGDKATEELMRSPSVSSSVELILSKFSDTEWDVETTGAKLEKLNHRCRDLARRVKYPTRFPIVPFESTTARVRAADKGRRERKALVEIDANFSAAKVTQIQQPAAVDVYGRTRAATKRLSPEEKGTKQADATVHPDVQLAGHKRQRSSRGASQLPGGKKLRTRS